jgi:hypothetical protein
MFMETAASIVDPYVTEFIGHRELGSPGSPETSVPAYRYATERLDYREPEKAAILTRGLKC